MCPPSLSGSIAAMNYYAGHDELAGSTACMIGGMVAGGVIFNIAWDSGGVLHKFYQARQQVANAAVVEQNLEQQSLRRGDEHELQNLRLNGGV